MDTQELTRSYLAQGTHSGPAYRRIMEAILAGVESGTWSAGEQVPSENELVEALDLSRMTINRAYRELTTAGVLKRVRGVGTFIAEFKMPSSLVEIRNIAD